MAAYDFGGAYQLLVEVRSRILQGVEVEHTDAADATRMLAEAMLSLGQIDDAAAVIADLAAWPSLGPYQTAMLAVTHARVLTAQDRLDEAAAQYRAVAQRRPPAGDPGRWPALLAAAGAATIAADGHPATAEPALTRAYTCLADEYGTSPVDVLRIGVELTQLRMRLGGHDTAWHLATTLLPAAVAEHGRQHPLTRQLTATVDRLATPRRGQDSAHERPPDTADTQADTAPASGGRDTPTVPAPARWSRSVRSVRSVGRGPYAASWRSLPYWMLLAAVVLLGAASAAVITTLVIAGPDAARAPTAGSRSTPSRAAWTPVYAPAKDVRIVRDTGATIDVAWTDPSGGTRPAIVFLAEDDGPATVAGTVQAAATSFRLTGLDAHAHRYCVSVALAYSPTDVARSADACTARPTSTQNSRNSGNPTSSPTSSPPTSRRRPAHRRRRVLPSRARHTASTRPTTSAPHLTRTAVTPW
ncbi:hypothetical protein GCM10027610_117360 [Dactylosporangium cerinum]